MNQLKMDIEQAINRLTRSSWSQRRRPRELGIDRETVARCRRLARQAEEPNPAIPPPGSEAVEGAKAAIVPPPPAASTLTMLAPQDITNILDVIYRESYRQFVRQRPARGLADRTAPAAGAACHHQQRGRHRRQRARRPASYPPRQHRPDYVDRPGHEPGDQQLFL